jgi:hypothetical protein
VLTEHSDLASACELPSIACALALADVYERVAESFGAEPPPAR